MRQRSRSDFLSSTVQLHAIHDPEQNARIMEACVQQRAVHNRTIEHLLADRSDEPLQRNTAGGVTGLYRYWPAWRAEGAGVEDVPSIVARGAIAAAAEQMRKWEETNAVAQTQGWTRPGGHVE